MKPKLSIIILNYNTRAFLEQCLADLFTHNSSQFKKGEFEVIVVDNASTDDSVPMVEEKFPNALLLKQKTNGGFAKGNNQGIKKARGEWVLLLNPDTIVGKDVLEPFLKGLEKYPDTAVATVRLQLEDGTLDDACHRGFPTPWRALCHFSGLSALFPTSTLFNGYHLGYQNMDAVHEIEACCGAFMLVAKTVGDSLNWLDEDYFWYGEDLDFCYRVKQNNGSILFVPQFSVLHYKGVASGIKEHSRDVSSADRATRKRATRARFAVMRIFYEKHYKNKYPALVRWMVFLGIEIKYQITKLLL